MGFIKARNLTLFPVTGDDETGYTAGEPIKMAGMMDIKLTPQTDRANTFADDIMYKKTQIFSSCDVEFTMEDVLEEVRAKMLGKKVDSIGGVSDNANDIAPDFALAFKAGRDDGTWKYTVLYKGSFEEFESEHASRADKAEPKNQGVKGTFVARIFDEEWKYTLDTANPKTLEADVADFFTTVKEPKATTTP